MKAPWNWIASRWMNTPLWAREHGLIGKIEDFIFSFDPSSLIYAVCSTQLGSETGLFALPAPYLKMKDPETGLLWDPYDPDRFPAYSLSGMPLFYRGSLIYDHTSFQALLDSQDLSREAP